MGMQAWSLLGAGGEGGGYSNRIISFKKLELRKKEEGRGGGGRKAVEYPNNKHPFYKDLEPEGMSYEDALE